MSAQPLNREQWMAYCATLAQTYERAMTVDQRLNLMIDIDLLLDALEQATIDAIELEGVPDHWDEQEQRDIDAAKQEAATRKELIRTRILHKALHNITKA